MTTDEMTASTMTLEQVRLTGLRALFRDLEPVGLVRFLQQFETGGIVSKSGEGAN